MSEKRKRREVGFISRIVGPNGPIIGTIYIHIYIYIYITLSTFELLQNI
jgi:hypothetical protein